MKFRRRPLGWHLALLTACAALPVLVFATLLVVRTSTQERAQVERGMLDVSHALAAALDRELLVSVGVLELLAQSPRLAADDLAGFHVEATRVLAARPTWQSILVVTPDGQQVVNTLLPFGTPLGRVSEPESLVEVVLGGKPVVGSLAPGRVTSQLAVPVRVPVVRDGVLAYVLTAAVRPESLRDVLLRTVPPRDDEWARFFNDRNGMVVARSRDPERSLGHARAQVPLPGRLSDEFYRDPKTEGADVYVASTRAPFSRWTAGLAVPVAAVDGPLRRSLAVTLGTGLALVALTGAGAYFVGRRIAQRIRAATDSAKALTRGERVPSLASSVQEVAELGDALERSAALLQQREAERGELLTQAEAARREAESANRAKDDFLATLSHELRTPLAAMVGWVRMLRTGRLSEAQAAHGLEVIDRNLTVQTKVIADLLDVSRIIAGKLQLERRPMDVRGAVQEALEQVRHQADDRGVSVATTLPPHAARVDGDPARLVQIVGNLVANAVKFTPRGGRVLVEVSAREREVAMTVADTGIGISAEVLPHIFERFRQADAGGGVRGLGLGLTIVRNLVDLHDGRIDVFSEGEGRGSRFTVTLPRLTRRLDVPRELPTFDERRLPREGLRVLVVEDEPDSLEMLTTFLAARGLTVTGAASVEEALVTWTRQPFDALVSDLRMPGRDGYALVREIRARDDGKRVRAVAVSANAAAQDMQQSLLAGFDVHLAKPIDPEDLLTALA